MKSIKKKVLGLVASIAMVLSLFVLPVSVNAANENVAKIGDTEYATLAKAVQAVVNSSSRKGTVTLLKDASGGGIGLFNGKGAVDVDLTIDFGGHTYTCTDPAVGSVGTESQGFHLEKGNKVTLKNGSITVSSDSNDTVMLIQNYCNLTLQDLNLNGSSATQYIISSNYGDTDLKNVSINGTHNKLVAIDLMHWLGTSYAGQAPTMSIDNTSQELINGDIDVYCWERNDYKHDCKEKPNLEIYGGTYSSDVNQYVDSQHKVHYVDGEYIVAPMTEKITLSSAQENIHVGDSLTLKATVEPTDSLDAVTWSSSYKTVATVDATGKVTAVAPGKATITAKAGNQTAICEVTVYEVESDVEAPIIDTSKPVDEVTVGINDKESQQNISDTMTSIVDDIINEKEVTSVSGETVEKIKKAIDEGQVILTEVQVTPVKETEVNAQDKKVLEDHIDENVNIAQYLDINILVKANDQVIGEVNELDNEVTFTVAIPEDLMKEGRTFYVIRVHDGKAEKLDTVENEDGTLTFKTDKFSTYALAYEDAQESITTPITPVQPAQPGQSQDDVKGETVVTPDNNQQVTNTQNTQESAKEPKTGDTSNIALYGAMALISLGLVGAIVLKKKVSEK